MCYNGNMRQNIVTGVKILLLLILLAAGCLLLAQKIDLTTADLGRHIVNGETVLSRGLSSRVLSTNFYSYTQAAFPAINHHWGAGVIFYWLTTRGGFNSDSIFYIAMGALTLLVMFDLARKISNFWIALGLSSLLLPLMMSRTEVRPETITYFFSSVFFWVLWESRSNPQKPINRKLLWLLPFVTMLWANIHIGWFFGPLLIVLFLAGEVGKNGLNKYQSVPSRLKWRDIYKLFVNRPPDSPSSAFGLTRGGALVVLLILCGLASLINPNFINGALEPLTIFRHYGYLIVENQSIPFLERLNHAAGLHFILVKVMMLVMGAGLIVVLIKSRKKIDVTLVLLGLTVSVMAWFGLRNFPFFGFFVLPVMSYFIIETAGWFSSGTRTKTFSIADAVIIPVSVFLFFAAIGQTYQVVLARGGAEGIGLLPGAEQSAEFFKQNNIQGPIFNDYDIGGYLIYNLFPGQKVFVDNRPEAYPVSFFQDVYIPAQQDENRWKQLEEQYHFNAIFFSYRDLTPWAQTFLVNRVKDPQWAPVFADGYNIIFLKRNQQNAELIKKYELPKSMFGVSKQ